MLLGYYIPAWQWSGAAASPFIALHLALYFNFLTYKLSVVFVTELALLSLLQQNYEASEIVVITVPIKSNKNESEMKRELFGEKNERTIFLYGKGKYLSLQTYKQRMLLFKRATQGFAHLNHLPGLCNTLEFANP